MNKHRPRNTLFFTCAALVLVTLATVGLARGEDPDALSPREIVERAGGAVVLIEVETDDGTSQGSGFLVGDTLAIVTCLHVIDGASSVTVSFHDGTSLDGVVVRSFDVERDLVVLVADPPTGHSGLTTIDLGDTTKIEPGARILVIGNPLGLEHTVTDGIVSAWRDPGVQETDGPRGEQPSIIALTQSRLLQISAAISPGSSGGPVLNDRAEVIGVATSGVLWGMAGLNFAVPVDGLPALLEQDDTMDLETFRERVDDVRRELARPFFDDGRVAYELDEIEEATHRLERALQLFPRYEEALLLSGKIAMEAGEVDLAEQRFTLATELDEYNADSWFYLGEAHQLKALASYDMAELSRAESAFERALEIDYQHGKAAFALALIQIEKGDLERAERLLVTATESEPGFSDAYYALGEVHVRSGRPAEAKDAFERALWDDDGHALSHLGLAQLYMDLERSPHGVVAAYGRAAHHWEEFLRLSEDDSSLDDAREAAIFIIKQYFPHLLD